MGGARPALRHIVALCGQFGTPAVVTPNRAPNLVQSAEDPKEGLDGLDPEHGSVLVDAYLKKEREELADTTQHRVRHVLPSLMEAAERRSEMQHHEMVSKLDALAHRLARLEGAK